MGLVSDGKKAVALVRKAVRNRSAAHDVRRALASRPQHPPFHYRVAVYFADGAVNTNKLADALEDRSWDAVVRAETEEALALTGRDVGTPIIHFEPPEGVAFFGPVISRLPADEDAVALWDHVVALAEALGERLRERGVKTQVIHRDLGRE